MSIFKKKDETQPLPVVKAKGAGGRKAKDTTAPLLGPVGRSVPVQEPECDKKGHSLVPNGTAYTVKDEGSYIPRKCNRSGCTHTEEAGPFLA